jgi:predicted nucleic acid-binding protein
MSAYVLDTNAIAHILRNDVQVTNRFQQEYVPNNTFFGCPFVYYEVRRGLLARDAKLQMAAFETLFASFQWAEYTRIDWSLAASLWKTRKSMGRPIEDADLMIAVFALNRNAVLVTDNIKDFDGLGVALENWK